MFYPERLSQVKGISKKKANELSVEFEIQREVRDIVMFLQKFSISPLLATKIYKEIGKDAKNKITQNPYILADRVQGIGFKTADRIAFDLGIMKDSEFRIKSGIIYVLQRASQAGNTFLPKHELIDLSCKILGAKKDTVDTVLTNFVFEDKIVVDGDNIYLTQLYNSEKNSAFRLFELMVKKDELDSKLIIQYIEEYQKIEKIIFDEEQKTAIIKAINTGVLVITGGPGNW